METEQDRMSGPIQNFRDLVVWQKAILFAKLIYVRSYAVGDVNCRSLDIRQRNRAAIGELMARKPTKPTESDALVHQLRNS